jgi:membrane-anchored glycerophosphoryl diester phosphodiesterase (GDPDase)
MGMIKDLNKVKKYIKVGQKIDVLSQSMVTRSAHTEKTFTKTVKEIVPPEEFRDWPLVVFKNDNKRYAVFIISSTISFRWGSAKREYVWVDGPTVREETLIEKYLG